MVLLDDYMALKRVTIIIDDDLDKKLHMIRVKRIKKEQKFVSYSGVIDQYLRKVL